MSKSHTDIIIRNARDEDMLTIQKIYAHQVRHGVSSWEEQPPSLDEMVIRRDATILAGYPYRVAVCGDEVLGSEIYHCFRSRTY